MGWFNDIVNKGAGIVGGALAGPAGALTGALGGDLGKLIKPKGLTPGAPQPVASPTDPATGAAMQDAEENIPKARGQAANMLSGGYGGYGMLAGSPNVARNILLGA